MGVDYIQTTKDQAEDLGIFVYNESKNREFTGGINWLYLWGEKGYSNTSVSYSSTKYVDKTDEVKTENRLLDNRSLEQSFRLRNRNYYRLHPKHRWEFGVDAKAVITDYDNFYAEYTSALGDTVPALAIDAKIQAEKYGVFTSFTSTLWSRITTTVGIRLDYFSYSEKDHASPRFSLSYQMTDRTSIKASYGIYYQNLPLILLSQNDAHKNLKDPKAVHYVLGFQHLLSENIRLSLEVYHKDYDHFPLDPAQPQLFILDELYYRYGFFFNHEQLVDQGAAFSRGVELVIQKKLAKDIYGTLSASYFKSRYRDYDGIWRDRVFDNRYIVGIEGGYKPNNRWEFSLRWIYAGGPPYTPFDEEASHSLNRGVFDEDNINGARYPTYHSLNIRFDRRFHFSRSNLIFYFSVWNAYNRKNVASYLWNEMENKQDTLYQWSLLPIFGLEFEF